ncbi:hypothetical protein LVB87_14320 [Lysobacter sp. KIS68-7]|uniref:EF-hand domain-containing protein n=1 Tax=Lysobacter sp. KIS68-7 TaxID=2904252 RepID=UPI001E62CEFB|nr:hypothetical protein [Lysobacter sp. KIS68-7]UHQ19342.1 hypothetical protein LVB87_14320 [Lysobacter sp. KIS68-7]
MRSTMLFSALALLIASAPCLSQNAPIAKTANERFNKLDVNHDGVLSRYETDAEIVLGVLDTDGDGQITAAELKPLLGPNADDKLALDRIRVADRTADDKLNVDEIERAANIRFDWLDANHDGNVDEAELQSRFLVPLVTPGH